MKKQNHLFITLIPAVVMFLSFAQPVRAQVITQTFNSNGTFTVPADVTSITVECWGAGGGGSTITANGRRGGGGGGGAYASGVLTVIPGNSYAVAVGAGGVPSSAGGNSSFNTNSIVAAGGTGGTNNSTTAGAGGSMVASTGTIRYAGGNGANGDVTANFSGGGGGGAGSAGTGGNASGSTGGTGTATNGGSGGNGVSGSSNGQTGNNYGGGGSGAVTNTGTDRTGGTGAAGLVIISYTLPIFYSRGSDPTVPSNWNTLRAGGGSSPTNFTANNQIFIIQPSFPMTAGAPWSVSGTNTLLQVENGATLTANAAITLSANTTFQIDNGATYRHMVSSNAVWGGSEIINPGSMVVYGFAGAQDIAVLGYGNLTISGGNTKTILGNTTVSGILTMTLGNIATGSYTLSLTNSAPGSLSYTSGTITGRFQRAVGSTGTDYLFPVGTSAFYRPAKMNFSSLSAGTNITAEFITTAPAGFTGYTDGTSILSATFNEGYWRFSSSGLPSAAYSLSLTGNGFSSYSVNEATRITGRDNGNTTWRAIGDHGTVSGNEVSRTAITNLNTTSFDFALATGCFAISMGYSYERNVTIDYTKVTGGSDLFNFPVMISLSGQNFLQAFPTGQILNPNGFDIIFTDVNYNELDYQMEYYNGTTGNLIAWVRIPLLSSSSNTVIKILYGNPLITTDPSVTTVWDSHYKGVWHLNNNSLKDFTSFNFSGTPYNAPSYSPGRIYNSLELNGTTQYAAVLNDPNINITGNLTVSAWVYMDTRTRDQKIAGNQNNSSGGYKFGIYTNNKVEFEIRNSANVPSLNRDVGGGTVLNTGEWYYLAGISSDVLDSIKTFVNGISERPFKKTGTLVPASNNLTIGREPFISDYFFDGRIDELRISDKVRSNGWMRTEYNNQFSPLTFYGLDATGTISNYLPSEGFCIGPIALTFGYPAGGVYSGNPYVSGNLFTPPSPGTYSITYTYSGGCGSASVTKNFIITNNPPAPVAADKEYCSSQITYLEASSGVNIRWYSGGTLVSTANPFSTGQTAPGTYNYTVTQTVNGCESPATAVTLTIYNGITIVAQPQPATTCIGSNVTFSVVASGYNLSYRWQQNNVNISDGGVFSGTTTPTLTLTNPGAVFSGRQYRCVITTTCGPSPATSNAALLTVNPTPVATFSYPGTPYCPNAPNPMPAFSGGGVAGTFSSTAGLVFVNTATGQVNLAASTPGSYTVTNTIAPSGGCGGVAATGTISIISDFLWTGASGSDWNNAGNWSCGLIPTQTNSVQIPDVPNKPVLNAGSPGIVKNLVIASGSSLVVTGNTIRVSGTITNNGIFNVTDGIVEMNGLVAQTIASDVFSGNTVRDLIINNPGGVTLLGPLNITGSVAGTNGNLASDGHLTLISTAAGTAFVDGAGTGTITGNVTMQRYLPSVYGYKYVSSPFQGATVGELGDDMNLASAFPLFYRYDEARTSSGWVSYVNAANIMNPLQGYSVNFGVAGTPGTIDISGVVNNGPLSVTLANNNNTYTKGFNLVGNPYPSAIDWDAAGWTKTSIDNAVYYFRASTTDQYGGTYSSYVNGISTAPGIATNIIPSMQGFFVHVSDGSYPVTGTLGLDNSVRVNNRTHNFLKSAEASERFLIRATASFTDDAASYDPTVIYFTTGASPEFDNSLDALKLLNTDMRVANVYSMLTGGKRLSVNALPESADTALLVPLGLRTNRDGEVNFKIMDLENLPGGVRVFFRDKTTGANINMLPDRDYKVVLTTGTYNDRFSIAFLKNTTGIDEPESSSDLFTAYASKGMVRATVWALEGREGTFTVFDLNGQPLFVKKVFERGRLEFNPLVKPGIYIVSFVTGSRRGSLKMALGF